MPIWIMPTPDQDPDSADQQFKLAAASTVGLFDFGNFDELEPDGTTLVGTPTVTVDDIDTGLVIGSPTLIEAYRVTVPISGGTAGADYVLTCSATTAAGETLIGRGPLKVR